MTKWTHGPFSKSGKLYDTFWDMHGMFSSPRGIYFMSDPIYEWRTQTHIRAPLETKMRAVETKMRGLKLKSGNSGDNNA